jgi:hypothetical protein
MQAAPDVSAPVKNSKIVYAFQRQPWYWLLGGTALVYALVAGLQTLSEFDLFWQMATGRWVVQHHAVFSTDVFSYTAAGQPWIYPVGSGLIFYFTYLLGGYNLLSWLGAAACVGTTVLFLRRKSALSALIAILAIPAIALRCSPRADIFTVVLFAFFLSVLWERHERGKGAWWALPPLMALWVNLHLGFLAGLGLALAYTASEAVRLLVSREKWNSRQMQILFAWLASTLAATLLNPWGWGIYSAISRQEQAMAAHSAYILEWTSIPLNKAALSEIFALREPASATMWILLVAVIATLAALFRRQWLAALLLAGSLWTAVGHMRFLALLACVVVIVGGSVLTAELQHLRKQLPFAQLHNPIAATAAIAIILLAALRSTDLVNGRASLRGDAITAFGTGLSWWFPERALDFIAREHLPAQVFNGYEDGGFVQWKLGPEYKDYVDSRAIPFGPDLFPKLKQVMDAPVDSEVWRQTADAYGIHTVVFSLARYDGLVYVFDSLKSYCNSPLWRPVYMDENSAVFVERTPQTESVIARYPLDCSTVPIPGEAYSHGTGAEFNRWANAAALLLSLNRTQESLQASNKALSIYPDAPWILYFRARAEMATGRVQDAERDLLRSASLDDRQSTWSLLSDLYRSQGKITEAANAMEHLAADSPQPARVFLMEGNLYLQAQRPQDAARAFDHAEKALDRSDDRKLSAAIAHGRAAVWTQTGNLIRATELEEQAVQFSPDEAAYWSQLAQLYDAQGRSSDAAKAQEQAAAASGGSGH